MNFIIHREAEIEFYNAVTYYEEQSDGLGIEFALEVFSTISQIVEHPFSWPRLSGKLRRCFCKRFPYSLVYEIIDEENLTILAIAHSSRKPGYWKDRLR